MIRRLLGEASRVIELKVAVNLVGGDVVVANPVLPHGLEKPERALDVGPEKRLGVGDGVIVMGLRRIVNDGVVTGNYLVQQLGVADVAYHKLDTVLGEPSNVLRVTSVGQLIENRDANLGVIFNDIAHEVATNKAAATRDDDILRFKLFRHD